MKYVFSGIETYTWGRLDWLSAINRVKNNRYDTWCFKIADGTNRWYTTSAIQGLCDLLRACDITPIPYSYSYGDKFASLAAEMALAREILQAVGVMCIDMESEWDGHIDWAARALPMLLHTSGTLFISTWANPADHNWLALKNILQPVIQGWMPQVYTSYVLGVWKQQWGNTPNLYPTYRPETITVHPADNYGFWELQIMPDKNIFSVTLSPSHEVALYVSASQFEYGETQFACGPFSVAENHYAAPVGGRLSASPEDVDTFADTLYERYIGTNIASNLNGTDVPTIHKMLSDAGLGYQDLAISASSVHANDIALIKASLLQGYPVIGFVMEQSIFDIQLNKNPYGWNTQGLSHILTFTGIDPGGGLIARDTANVNGIDVRPQPRIYKDSFMIFAGLMIQLPWLTKIPAGYDPIKQPPIKKEIKHMTPAQLAQAKVVWATTANLFQGGVSPSMDLGIGKSWQSFYANSRNFGPPMTPEFPNTDWSGKPVVQQLFMFGLAEWSNGQCRWFSAYGEIKM
jgi:hypothetical protein